MFKALIAVKARNAIIASPHPNALRCTREAMNVVRDAAEQAGAPRALMACLGVPTAEGTAELMRHKLTSIILATGSNAMVRAAYSSGKPAYGRRRRERPGIHRTYRRYRKGRCGHHVRKAVRLRHPLLDRIRDDMRRTGQGTDRGGLPPAERPLCDEARTSTALAV